MSKKLAKPRAYALDFSNLKDINFQGTDSKLTLESVSYRIKYNDTKMKEPS